MVRILKITALILAFLTIAGISAYFTLSVIIKSEDTVLVPDLIGRDVVFVLEQLTDLGLNTKVRGSEFSEAIPKNHIIFQDPKAGSEIKKGRDVKIVLSKGTQSILMPNLVGLPERQARIILEENSICGGMTSRVHHPHLDKDVIVAQLPLSGQLIRRGSCVDLLVSSGAPLTAIKMPDFEGLPYEEALVLAEQKRLVLGPFESAFDPRQQPQIVLEQKPLAGYRIAAGDRIHLVINQLPENDGQSEALGFKSKGLLQYLVNFGFLKKRLHVSVKTESLSTDLFDDYVNPGEEIWLWVPESTDGRVVLLEDQKPVFPGWKPGWPRLLEGLRLEDE